MSDSVGPYGQQPTRLLCPQDSLGKSTGVGCHVLLHVLVSAVPENESDMHIHISPPFLKIPSVGDYLGEGIPLWYSCLGNPMDRGAWWAMVHGVPKS